MNRMLFMCSTALLLFYSLHGEQLRIVNATSKDTINITLTYLTHTDNPPTAKHYGLPPYYYYDATLLPGDESIKITVEAPPANYGYSSPFRPTYQALMHRRDTWKLFVVGEKVINDYENEYLLFHYNQEECFEAYIKGVEFKQYHPEYRGHRRIEETERDYEAEETISGWLRRQCIPLQTSVVGPSPSQAKTNTQIPKADHRAPSEKQAVDEDYLYISSDSDSEN